jgi:hypothetical protein
LNTGITGIANARHFSYPKAQYSSIAEVIAAIFKGPFAGKPRSYKGRHAM